MYEPECTLQCFVILKTHFQRMKQISQVGVHKSTQPPSLVARFLALGSN